MKTKLFTITLILGIVFALEVNAKTIDFKGKVTSFNMYPLQKVSITINKTGTEIVTNKNGEFSFTCDENARVKFKASGFFTQKIKVADYNENSYVNINLQLKKGDKNIQLAINKGHITKEQLFCGIEVLKDDDFSIYSNMKQVLTNRIAGLTVGESSIYIRSGVVGPPALLVVDNRIVDFVTLSNINTDQIKSIRIMKTNEATGHYGNIALGGALLVETQANLKYANNN